MELVCIVHARPSPHVVWSKDERPIEELGHVEKQDKGHRHSLQINDVTENDFGKYECEAMNDMGSASASIHLTGKRGVGIDVHLFIYLFIILENSFYEINCHISLHISEHKECEVLVVEWAK